jgi:adenylate kinase
MDENKKIVILIGPPGCGKGTQADMLAEQFNLFHFETSKIIQEKITSASPDDAVLMREKELYDSGELNTPELARGWVMDKVNELYAQGRGIVFSGSPRTLPEAEIEMPFFERLYGKINIHAINIKLSREESFNRNSHRRICKLNRHPIPNFKEYETITTCPKDGSELVVRKELDDPETILVRYEVYQRRTEPIIEFLKDHNYSLTEINGEQSIEKVYDDIIVAIKFNNDN